MVEKRVAAGEQEPVGRGPSSSSINSIGSTG